MNNTPKVVILTVTRNLINVGRRDFFRQCVESVHNQTYENIEHIIIDGASTDGTLDIIKMYADKGWLTFYSEKDTGIYQAMNKGIDKANGVYINFLNSDDFFNHPDGIKISLQHLFETNADYSFAECLFINSRGEYLGIYQPVIESFLFRMPFCHQTMLIKKETMLTLNKFDESFNSAADFDFVLRLCLSGAKFVEVPSNFVSFRSGGISYVNQEQSICEYTRSCINNLNIFAKYDFKTYRQMYENLLLPKKLYEAIIHCLIGEYKRRFINLIENHSQDKGNFYKINKYAKLVETSYYRTLLRKRTQHYLHRFKMKIRRS
jgi:glycosyltransferase involved in cell wall biosynthesis